MSNSIVTNRRWQRERLIHGEDRRYECPNCDNSWVFMHLAPESKERMTAESLAGFDGADEHTGWTMDVERTPCFCETEVAPEHLPDRIDLFNNDMFVGRLILAPEPTRLTASCDDVPANCRPFMCARCGHRNIDMNIKTERNNGECSFKCGEAGCSECGNLLIERILPSRIEVLGSHQWVIEVDFGYRIPALEPDTWSDVIWTAMTYARKLVKQNRTVEAKRLMGRACHGVYEFARKVRARNEVWSNDERNKQLRQMMYSCDEIRREFLDSQFPSYHQEFCVDPECPYIDPFRYRVAQRGTKCAAWHGCYGCFGIGH